MGSRGRLRLAGEKGIVGFNLALTIAFALFAVIELSRVTLAAKQIDDRVKVITNEVGPGSNVSRLDETKILDTVGQTAEDILAAAAPLTGQAQQILDATESIDSTVSDIRRNASEINGTVRSIDATATALQPVVVSINGNSAGVTVAGGGVEDINRRADLAMPPVAGIRDDLNRVSGLVGLGGTAGHTPGTIHEHVNSINCAPILLAPGGCNQF
ncbi:MAG: hypothetical protein ACT4OS_01630 [Acidimicrobiales bacterium]